MRYPQDEIERMEQKNEIPTRLVVLDLEGKVIGYKVDTCWNLSTNPERYKVHPFQDTKSRKHLAGNLLFYFNECNQKNEFSKGTWFEKYLEGVIVSAQAVSKSNFGEELLRYNILKERDKYIAKKINR